MTSIWENNASIQRFCELDGDLNTDTLIIGGGIAGLLCAYKLKAAGVDCILLEADRILGGVTGGTTAKLTLAHGLIYDRLIKSFGIESARLYLEAQKEALAEYDSLCQDIDCDYERKDSYVYSLTDRYKIDNELKALDRLGVI
ncbi:MAG: FAD-binding oxidoreductase, partial [Clostridia bacterium]|nr:FAD-binding oxidoreductase [Clostridia bacterium]